jgi:hypothetical protein
MSDPERATIRLVDKILDVNGKRKIVRVDEYTVLTGEFADSVYLRSSDIKQLYDRRCRKSGRKGSDFIHFEVKRWLITEDEHRSGKKSVSCDWVSVDDWNAASHLIRRHVRRCNNCAATFVDIGGDDDNDSTNNDEGDDDQDDDGHERLRRRASEIRSIYADDDDVPLLTDEEFAKAADGLSDEDFEIIESRRKRKRIDDDAGQRKRLKKAD